MWRYVKEAFWVRVATPLMGGLPVNALAVTGFGILGCAEHALWLLGLGLETAYLYAVATHPRFQHVVNARERERTRQDDERSRRDLLAGLPPEARARRERLEGKLAAIAALYRMNGSDNLMLDSNMDALQKLAALHLRLLVAGHHLQTASRQADEEALTRQEAALARELAAGGGSLSASLRESKQATLELIQKRLANARRRAESLAGIASDLARIEAQVDLAQEDAGLEGNPARAASNLHLLSQILESNSTLGGLEILSAHPPASTAPRTTGLRDRQTEPP